MDATLRGVVAVDGPSGTGKSTTARGLAMRLDARYLDTGAMYRAATLAVLRSGLSLDLAATTAEGHDDVVAVVLGARLELSTDPAEPRVRLDGEDVGAEIRGTAVTGAVSAVSALTAVRAHLVSEQRRIVAEALADGTGIVVEGRDIGTVVVPDAGLKIFLTASALVRAGRRDAENTAAGRVGAPDTQADLARRDTLDSSRAASPLRPAEDAVEVDTSTLDIDGVLDRLQGLAEDRDMIVGFADAGVGSHKG
ncbi:cytidylate kinase [Actinomycetospora sp. NBRC 106375]|uniref:(d)CMP kinase n=1 Tax=Actinomycetospora sp. NBRC 106375 TaxID=3032207 RepID=UPI0024A1C871|nr:(d)CMP kinase [Actinomycetospora sp. NBRC 106375]GLZ49938.1 cytidylate kinase [Actinomycetospora sp. NBRC 106375]